MAAFASTMCARGVSSAGRAPALQAGGHRFDPGTLHLKKHPICRNLSLRGSRHDNSRASAVRADRPNAVRSRRTWSSHGGVSPDRDGTCDPVCVGRSLLSFASHSRPGRTAVVKLGSGGEEPLNAVGRLARRRKVDGACLLQVNLGVPVSGVPCQPVCQQRSTRRTWRVTGSDQMA